MLMESLIGLGQWKINCLFQMLIHKLRKRKLKRFLLDMVVWKMYISSETGKDRVKVADLSSTNREKWQRKLLML